MADQQTCHPDDVVFFPGRRVTVTLVIPAGVELGEVFGTYGVLNWAKVWDNLEETLDGHEFHLTVRVKGENLDELIEAANAVEICVLNAEGEMMVKTTGSDKRAEDLCVQGTPPEQPQTAGPMTPVPPETVNYVVAYVCVKCEAHLTDEQRLQSEGVCPWCGNVNKYSNVVEAKKISEEVGDHVANWIRSDCAREGERKAAEAARETDPRKLVSPRPTASG